MPRLGPGNYAVRPVSEGHTLSYRSMEDTHMRNFDFSPLYRASVGFDQMANLMDRLMAEGAPSQGSYPPYNIEKTAEDGWRITLAVAGFGDDELNVEVKEQGLTVSGKRAGDEGDRVYLHRGIATRAFERRFHLADHVRVTGAEHRNGMLHIDLVREVPEALKPRQIEIVSREGATQIEAAE